MIDQVNLWVSFNKGGSVCSMNVREPDSPLCPWDKPWVKLTTQEPPARAIPNIDEFVNSLATSDWAKSQLPALEARDVVDVISDLEIMLDHFKGKFNSIAHSR